MLRVTESEGLAMTGRVIKRPQRPFPSWDSNLLKLTAIEVEITMKKRWESGQKAARPGLRR
jgi:hypothetical protein